MLQVISPKSSAYLVQADPEHLKRVFAERRRRCVGEGFRAVPPLRVQGER
jgi:hypothetical protein